MPRFGLIVEGPYDEKVLPLIVRKLVPTAIIDRPLVANGKIGNKIAGFLPISLRSEPDRVIAVSDANGHAANQLQLQRFIVSMRDRCAALSDILRPAVLVPEMEVLLLADPEAVNVVCHERRNITGRELPAHPKSVEDINDPKRQLQEILLSWGIVYTADVACKIAEAARVEMLEQWCRQSWGHLRAALAGA